jgi:hypothetical protein
MEKARIPRPSPALIVALVALVAAMSGAAVALPGKNTVNSGDIKDGDVRAKDLERDAVRSKHVKGKSLRGSDVQDDALKGKQILEDKLEAVPAAKTVETVTPFGAGIERVGATDGPSEAAAQAAAPRVALATKGTLSVYAKCFRDAPANRLFGEIYIESSEGGAIFDASGRDRKPGGAASADFLNPDTPEEDRELASETITGGGAAFEGEGDGWRAMAPDGTGLTGTFAVAVKNGNLAGGNGVYGDGNVCLFSGSAIG